MNLRNRLVSLAGVAALATSGLVAAGAAPAANAAALDCPTLVGAVNAANRIVYRTLDNSTVLSTKTSKVISGAITSLLPGYSDQVSGGSRTIMTAYAPGTRPRLLRVTNLEASDTLSVAALKTTYTHAFNAKLVANSGSYYVYAVSTSTGNLVRWTRYQDRPGTLTFDTPKTVATGMSGLKTLTYAWTFKVDGGYRDFLIATTKSGALKQIQIPHQTPSTEKQVTLATSGFADVVGISPSFCNDNPRHLSMIAINGTQARWWTLGSQTAPTPSGLVDRGLVAGEHDWNLHAVS